MNAPKNSAGDEVTGPVRWMTVRSDNNDKFAQPDGLWIGAKGTPTNVTYAGPELKGATNVVNLRPERIADADRSAQAIVIMTRPRGYLDPNRDRMSFDGQSPPAGAPRPVLAEFNGEKLAGRTWPAAGNHVSVPEMTY